ncbi:MAG: hypothetical protein ACRC67_06825 [Inquilinus sp.]|uniref:nSTAND1 domain-containing NTPase n=1 Tax=Inquilinus sp. TaxID=1932117 RepID=UPI003F396415
MQTTIMASLYRIRVFLSSPGDVQPEHDVAKAIVERIAGEFAEVAHVDAISWVDEPVRANATFQDSLPRPSDAADILVCLFWLRLGTPLPLDSYRRADGSAFESGTVFELEDALVSHGAYGKPEILIYRKVAEPRFPVSSPMELAPHVAQWEALTSYLDRLTTNADGSNAHALRKFRTQEELSTLLEQHLRKLVGGLIEDRAPHPAATAVRSNWFGGSPFRGLEAFDFEHADIFHGRSRAAVEIKGRITQRQEREGLPFVLVYGASGVGKSSLVRAGVMPRLARPGAVSGVTAWRRCSFVVGERPLQRLLMALLSPTALPELAEGGESIEHMEHQLLETPGLAPALLLQGVRTAMARTQSAIRLVLLVDQGEALFTYHARQPSEVTAFVAVLRALTESGLVWTMMTMRSDFFHRCVEIAGLAELRSGIGHYELRAPEPAELAQIIRAPALAAGLSFETSATDGDLADVLLADALRGGSPLPLLEFTLSRLYAIDRATRVLRFSSYRSLGGIEGAFNTYAEEQIAHLPEAEQQALPRLLERLVALDEREERRPIPKDMVYQEGELSPTEAALLETLIDASLITSAERGGTVSMRLVHEAMLTNWSRATQWINQNGMFLVKLGRLERAARLWLDDPGFLLTGQALRDALELSEQHGKALSEAGRALVAASRKAEEDAVTESARREVERLAQQVRQGRIRMRILTAAAGTAFLLCIAVFLLLQQANETLFARLDEEAARAQATAVESLAEGQLDRAIRNVLASPVSRRPKVNAELDRVLARAVVRHPRAGFGVAPEGEKVTAHDQSESGSVFATGTSNGTLRVWDLVSESGRAVLRDDARPIDQVALAPSADMAAAASGGDIVIWDVTNKARLARLEMAEPPDVLRFSPDGALLAIGSPDGRTVLWDYRSGDLPRNAPPLRGAINALAFSHDAKRIAVGSSQGDIVVVRLADMQGEPIQRHGGIVSLRFSSDDQQLLIASKDRQVSLLPLSDVGASWNVALSDAPRTAELSPGGDRLLAIDIANELTVWVKGRDDPIARANSGRLIADAVFMGTADEIAWIETGSLHRASITPPPYRLQQSDQPLELNDALGIWAGEPVSLRFDAATKKLSVVMEEGAGFLLASDDLGSVKAVGLPSADEAFVVPCSRAPFIAVVSKHRDRWISSLLDLEHGSTLARWALPPNGRQSAGPYPGSARTCLDLAFAEQPDGTLSILTAADGRPVVQLLGPAEAEHVVAVAKSQDGILRFWKLSTGMEITPNRAISAPEASQTIVAGNIVAINEPTNSRIIAYDIYSGEQLSLEESIATGNISVDTTGSTLAVVTKEGDIRLWRLRGSVFDLVDLKQYDVKRIVHQVDLSDKMAVLATQRGSLLLDWRNSQAMKVRAFDQSEDVRSVSFSGLRWVAATAEGLVIVRQVDVDEKLDAIKIPPSSPTSPRGIRIVDLVGRLVIWNEGGGIWSNEFPSSDTLRSRAQEMIQTTSSQVSTKSETIGLSGVK